MDPMSIWKRLFEIWGRTISPGENVQPGRNSENQDLIGNLKRNVEINERIVLNCQESNLKGKDSLMY